VQKWQNESRWRFGFGLGWAQGSMGYMGMHSDATWPKRLNPLCAASPPHMDGSIVFARWRHCAFTYSTCFLEPTWVENRNGISIRSVIFAQLTAECRQEWPDMSFPLKTAPYAWADLDPSNTWFLWPTHPNGISIDSAVFWGLTTMTDRQTDRPR